MKNKIIFTCAPIFFVDLLSCNPDCDSLTGDNLSSTLNSRGYEVLISADPPSALQGRRIFFNDTEVESTFIDGNGLMVKVPDGLAGGVELRIEDPDCVDFLSFDYTVVGETFFQDNPNYVFPPT